LPAIVIVETISSAPSDAASVIQAHSAVATIPVLIRSPSEP
jgi:hypothetical protein